ncbi:Serine/threonine-protein kinase CBK1 [Sesamum angolense]|uniref:non-specific serine/threonine protein kinase n=1 Tax=Sesamum angolense TaxID=2727404 RepID=A0AAE1WEH6_9LAMI|nr:Serine/threonine-protein kinase CBK1 [Sesamum angolense]
MAEEKVSVVLKEAEEVEEEMEEEQQLGSSQTLERVAAAKNFIENHYKSHMKDMQQRRERREVLEKALAKSGVSEQEQMNILKDLERKETEYMRLKRHKISVDDFELLAIIGRGAFGEVEHVKAERNLLAEVASRYIVKLHCSFQDAEYLYLVMEYLPGGDVMTLLMREDTLTETVARFYIAQSVLAIESIHKHNYIHRDIKPDNLLLDRYGHMRLSDFGLCKPLDCSNLSPINGKEPMTEDNLRRSADANGCVPDKGDGSNWKSPLEQLQHWQMNRRTQAFSTVGTPDYIAPEVLLKKAMGLSVIAEARLTPEAKDLIRSLLRDADTRLGSRGADEIKAHPWFKDVNWDMLYEMEAAYKPEVNGELDTQNFMKYDEVASHVSYCLSHSLPLLSERLAREPNHGRESPLPSLVARFTTASVAEHPPLGFSRHRRASQMPFSKNDIGLRKGGRGMLRLIFCKPSLFLGLGRKKDRQHRRPMTERDAPHGGAIAEFGVRGVAHGSDVAQIF